MLKKRILLLAYGEMGRSALVSLKRFFEVVGVVTPEKKRSLYRSTDVLAVEKVATEFSIPIKRTNSLGDLERLVKTLKPDAVVICSYNKIIPAAILSLSKFINVHHGDLPRWRGRANLNWAIILGRKTVGVTIHEAVEELDAGNIYAQFTIRLDTRETISTLYHKVNMIVEKNLARVVVQVLEGYTGRPQKGKATYCCTRLPEDGLIDWNKSSTEIDRLIRGLSEPFPGAFSYLDGERIIIWEAQTPPHPKVFEGRIPGRVVAIHQDRGVEVLTGDSLIMLGQVSYRGRKMRADQCIKSVKKTLGLNLAVEYERLKKRINNFGDVFG